MQRRWIAGVVARVLHVDAPSRAGQTWLMRTRGLIGLVCVVGVLATACTSAGGAPATRGGPTMTMGTISSASSSSTSGSGSGSRSPSATTTTTASSKAASSTSPSPSTSTSTSTSIAPTTKPSASTSNPWPANLKPAQVKDAAAAIKAYRAYYDTLNAAYANPQKDWSQQITLLTAEPIRSQQLTALDKTKAQKQVVSGKATIEPRVTKVGTGDVYLRTCVDTSQTKLLTNGKSNKLPDVKGSYWRHISLATVTKYADGTWRVSAIDEQQWSTKC